jgi:hypothetical protein
LLAELDTESTFPFEQIEKAIDLGIVGRAIDRMEQGSPAPPVAAVSWDLAT